MVVRMKKLYDLVSKPTAVRKLSCSDCMTATKAFRKSLGVILFIACLKPTLASITHCATGLTGMRSNQTAYDPAPTLELVSARMFRNLTSSVRSLAGHENPQQYV